MFCPALPDSEFALAATFAAAAAGTLAAGFATAAGSFGRRFAGAVAEAQLCAAELSAAGQLALAAGLRLKTIDSKKNPRIGLQSVNLRLTRISTFWP